jgi:phage-related tail fiber protein
MDVSNLPGLISGSWLSVWSYRFFVVREDTQASRPIRQRTVTECLENTPGAHELTTEGVVTIEASSVEVLDALNE